MREISSYHADSAKLVLAADDGPVTVSGRTDDLFKLLLDARFLIRNPGVPAI